MLDFMIIALPRSGTTWAANWLTTDTTHCVHDPLYTTHYEDWGSTPRFPRDRVCGVACTGIWRWPSWVNAQPCRKLILHKPLADVERSIRRLGADQQVDRRAIHALSSLEGRHTPWEALFDPERAADLWAYLTGGLPFNAERHRALVEMRVEPRFDSLTVDRPVVHRLWDELNDGYAQG